MSAPQSNVEDWRRCDACGGLFLRKPTSRALSCSPRCARDVIREQRALRKRTAAVRAAMARIPGSPARVSAAPGYASLASVLDEALQQAQAGKGRNRHSCGEPFEEQQIVQLGEWMGGSTAFAIGQACKKAIESTRLEADPSRARAELIGAINYLAAAVLVIDRRAEVRP